MLISLFCILVIVSNLYEKVETQYANYQVQLIKKKLFKMIADLMFDAKAKIQSIQHMKDEYSAKKAFEFAGVIYDIRRKYARMLKIHSVVVKEIRRPMDDYKDRKESEWYQKFMIEAVHIGGEIDKLIQAIEEHEYYPNVYDPTIAYNSITMPKIKKKKSGLRFISADKKLHQLFTLKGRRREDNDFDDSIQKVTRAMANAKRNSTTDPTTEQIKKKYLDGLEFDSELE